MRLATLLTLVSLPAVAQGQARAGDPLPSGAVVRPFYAVAGGAKVYDRPDTLSSVVLNIPSGAEMRVFGREGAFYVLASGPYVQGYVLSAQTSTVPQASPVVAWRSAAAPQSDEMDRMARRLRTVHRQTTFLTIVTAVSLGLAAASLVYTATR